MGGARVGSRGVVSWISTKKCVCVYILVITEVNGNRVNIQIIVVRILISNYCIRVNRSIHNTMYSAVYGVYTVHCTLYIPTMCTVQCILYTVNIQCNFDTYTIKSNYSTK